MIRGCFLLLMTVVFLAGCATPVPDVANRANISADQYDVVHAASVEVLRDYGFRVSRNDHRFGVVETYPKESPTLFEPWVGHNSTRRQARISTVNEIRRTVTVQIKPLAQNQEAPPAEDGEIVVVSEGYRVAVEVQTERLQAPARYTSHSARNRVFRQYASVPDTMVQRGITDRYWQSVSRDPQLERRLLDTILKHAGVQSVQAVQSIGGVEGDGGRADVSETLDTQ